jgi:hypothetical protein
MKRLAIAVVRAALVIAFAAAAPCPPCQALKGALRDYKRI